LIKVLYRISDGGNPKRKLPNVTKEKCLDNAISVFGRDNIRVFADNCGAETVEMVKSKSVPYECIKLGNAFSWRYAVEYSLNGMDPQEMVYLLEDDYFHLPASPKALEEALKFADYATLYDHPDKYISFENGGPNPFIENGSEATRVWLTKSSHWKQTNSTTMTFAARVQTLKEDKEVWWEFTSKGFPNDFAAFQCLQGIGSWENRIFGKKRILVSSIPGLSTHGENDWLTPLHDWSTF
jgi:hypothetical protein